MSTLQASLFIFVIVIQWLNTFSSFLQLHLPRAGKGRPIWKQHWKSSLKRSAALKNTDDIELQLKMQAAQHEHELKMLSMFTQFLARSNSPCPPFYQAPVQPSQYNPRQLPPQPTFYNFTQPPKFSLGSPQPPPCYETTNQPLSFLQDLAQPLPYNHPPAHPPDLPQPFSQVSAHPQGPAQQPFSQASGHPLFYRPPDDEEK